MYIKGETSSQFYTAACVGHFVVSVSWDYWAGVRNRGRVPVGFCDKA
jgi:hypothetical protein